MINIDLINGNKDWEDFLAFPGKIYRDNPYWVPPLHREILELLDVNKNPFWKHARREVFLARKNDEVVGRIAAIVDENHNSFHSEKTGFFGFFECFPEYEIARALLNMARHWCREAGMETFRGPVSPSMNHECAFLIEGFDKSPTVMMPYNPPYYPEFMEKYGLKKAKDLYSLFKRSEDGIPERLEKMAKIIKKKNRIKVRAFDPKNLSRDIQFFKDIYNSAWEKNWGFVPMTDEEIDLAARKLTEFADPELILFAEIDNKPVGVSVTIPDINQVLKRLNGKLGPIEMLKALYYRRKIDGLRSLIGGVKKEYRNTGIIAVLYYETQKRANSRGYRWGELGWNLEDNDLINQFDMAIGGKIYKKYRIYEMEMEPHTHTRST